MPFNTIRILRAMPLVGAVMIIGSSTASAVTIADCLHDGGLVLRCSEQPVTNADKVICPAPGKTIRIWCVGGFWGTPATEILDPGGQSRYR